jgi:hypothetical protein
MKTVSTLIAAGLIAASAPLFAGAAAAAPLNGPRALTTAPESSMVQTVQWRRGWNRGWHGGRWIGPAAGLAAGLAIGSALAPRYYYAPGYEYYDEPYAAAAPGVVAGDADAYCAQRFRSYDPASGTYLGYDGLRHPCP